MEQKLPPTEPDMLPNFRRAAANERSTGELAKVYSTGVMCDCDGQLIHLDETSLGLEEGVILWNLVRRLTPEIIVETGFGKGGSAAFFLSGASPWNGRLISIDPWFRQWCGEIGLHYLKRLGLAQNHVIIERPSELALADMISQGEIASLKLSYVDGDHHFDGTLFDFMYLDRLTAVGGVIAIDDAHSPVVRTVASYIANNLPYNLHYATERLLLCTKVAPLERAWFHFKPFRSSSREDWSMHEEGPTATEVPGATFSSMCSSRS
jgi:predicted O-methyltransferase YrrM